jgi:Flp pilus assembly pilin Flp
MSSFKKSVHFLDIFILNLMVSRASKQRGVTIIEYALIAAAITIAAVVFLPKIGSYVSNTFSQICSGIANGGAC